MFRRRFFVLILSVLILVSQSAPAMAKGFSSRGFSSKSFSSKSYSSKSSSKSYSSKSSSKSSGYTGSSSSKSSAGAGSSSSSGKSSAGYSGSGSSSRSVPGSSKSTSSASAKANSQKQTYMQDEYKKQASAKNYTAYKQTLNDEQKKVYDSTFNKEYKVNNRMDFGQAANTRWQRASYYEGRTVNVFLNRSLFGGPFSYGSAFIGPWDMWFLMRASDLFWYHHWHEIYPYRDNFDRESFENMEKRVKALEEQNNGVRDPDYLEPDVDPDLQFSDQYIQNNPSSVYYTDKYPTNGTSPVATLFVVVIIGAGLIFLIRKASRPKQKNTYKSRIY